MFVCEVITLEYKRFAVCMILSFDKVDCCAILIESNGCIIKAPT